MAGSIRWFKYIADSGVEYGFRGDESNHEAISNLNLALSDLPLPGIPRNIEARYCIYTAVNPPANAWDTPDKIRMIVSEASTLRTLPASIDVTLRSGFIQTYRLTFKSGERERVISNRDTGKLDGDELDASSGGSAP